MPAREKATAFTTPQPGQILDCRGATWRFLREEKGFWELELIKQGTQFTESLVRVWALPYLEKDSLMVHKARTTLAPPPTKEHRAKGKEFKPFIAAQRNKIIQDQGDSKSPNTALHCAIEHKPWQFEPWTRIVDQLPFPRLLIADDVGLGKTTEAAIILAELTRRRRADRVLIIAPQHLAEKWQDELYERFGLPFEIYTRQTRERLSDRGVKNPWEVVERVIVSRDFVKRWENLRSLSNVEWDMVVIDECHHFVKDKATSSTRLRDLAESIVYKSPGLLLLSATPFTGSKEEFNSLLRLIDPKFSGENVLKTWDPSNPCLVRRLKGTLKKNGEKVWDREVTPVEVTDKDLNGDEKKVLQEIHEVLSAHSKETDRQYWDRLVEETARKRLSSSWSAFLDSISGDGRLSQWFSDKQRTSIKKLIEKQESAKLRTLSAILGDIQKKKKNAKVVIFTEALPTQKEIQAYLTSKGAFKNSQVALIEGSTPKETRLAIEEQFSNPNSELLVLIATDTLSEGKDLQHACHHLIHFELPWSLVKIEQRNGRIDRLGQNEQPKIFNLIFNTEATPDQRVMNRLMEKIEAARDSLGSVSPIIVHGDNLNLMNPEEAEAELAIEAKIQEAIDFGFGDGGTTPISAAPISEPEDNELRKNMFKIMLETLGGKLNKHGNAQDEYLLSIPSDWDIPGIGQLADHPPSEDHPWRVTFHPQVFLEYEQYRREHGEEVLPLHFMSPIHPLVVQLETRFRMRLSKLGYPIFKVKDSAHKYMVVAELAVRAPSGRILSQRMTTIELSAFKEVDPAVLTDFKGLDGPVSLPAGKTWEKVEQTLQEQAKSLSNDVEKEYQSRLKKFLAEQKHIPDGTPGKAEREEWLNSLWTVEPESHQYQVLALVVGDKG